MAESAWPLIAADCPRCGQVRTTFDVTAETVTKPEDDVYEITAVCRSCGFPSIGEVRNFRNRSSPLEFRGKFLNISFEFNQWVFTVPGTRTSPNFVPRDIKRIFDEAANCAAIGAWDAAGTMYRKVLDAATRSLTPTPVESDASTPSWKVYKDLRLRLDWLFERNLLTAALKDLSSCIHQDGNDAAHSLGGIGETEAKDLGDFSEVVLETLYTIPGQIAENQRRREERRKPT